MTYLLRMRQLHRKAMSYEDYLAFIIFVFP